MRERRRYVRIDLCAQVEYEVLPMQMPPSQGETKNISAGGLCLLANEEMPTGTILHLKFYLPDKDKTYVESLGRVVWQEKVDEGYFTGIEFKNISSHLELKLSMFVLNFLKEIKERSKPTEKISP